MKKCRFFALIVGVTFAVTIQAADEGCGAESGKCVHTEPQGKALDTSRVSVRKMPPVNSEDGSQTASLTDLAKRCAVAEQAALPMFRISVDGEVVSGGEGRNSADAKRCSDLALAEVDIQIRYDSGEVTPWLNAHAIPVAIAPEGTIRFATYSNYNAWIKKAEIRLFELDRTVRQKPFLVLPVAIGGVARWQTPKSVKGEYNYLLRVYAADGSFDETSSKRITIETAPSAVGDDLLAGYGENTLELQNITVDGGAVSASGRNIRPGQRVQFMGMQVPVDGKGRFAVRQILPAGPHSVAVSVLGEDGEDKTFSRNLNIADDDWFYIGLVDLTLGRNNTSGPAKLVTADSGDQYDDKVYMDGRLAFYLKGKIKGKYLLTAAADSREQPLKDMFRNLSDKDPRYLLRRLDPDRYYPVYGDDSTAVDDAPTQGKFYVKLEKGKSHVMWGNFHTTVNDTDFIQYNRGLYGARARLISGEITEYGEKRGELEAFAADPGTLPARDEFRGTGGSLYYLQRQDVTMGSEQVRIEVRDKDSGLVLESRYLTPTHDYDLNYIQGRIMLREPLNSIADDGVLIQTGNLSGHPAYLVVTYEYTPGLSAPDDMVFGGRAQYWVNDHLRLGATGYRQKSPGIHQELVGADLILRYWPGTYMKLEAAQSDGAGSGASTSLDGGFNYNSVISPGGRANAGRVEVVVDLSELDDTVEGRSMVYWQRKERGFSAPGQVTGNNDVTQQGASLEFKVSESTRLTVKADQSDAGITRTKAAEVDLHTGINANWALAIGIRRDDREVDTATASTTLNQEGERTDVVVRVEYEPTVEVDDERIWSLYGYMQDTASKSGDRSDNGRIGVGGKRRINDRLSVNGEISSGDGGMGTLIGSDYNLDDRTSLYLNYQLDTDRTDTGYRGRRGMLTSGMRKRFSDSVSVYGEERWQHGDGASGLTHAYGLDLAPNEKWTFGAWTEVGDLSDPLAGDMERKAAGISVGYAKDRIKYAGNLEFRDEDGGAGERVTWLVRNTLGYQTTPDWRFLGRLNFSFSESSQGNFFDGDYVEVVSGFAYRPVDNDRLNALLKYTYFYDVPSPGQLTDEGLVADYAQRSHILSADITYDLKPWLSVGGKYGLKLGELKDQKVGGDWYNSLAQLLVLRADLHLIHEWDVVVEGRVLDVREAEDRRAGALVAVYRHMTDSVKVGVGYNFSDFSDDLTDVSYDSKGLFLNVIGKF